MSTTQPQLIQWKGDNLEEIKAFVAPLLVGRIDNELHILLEKWDYWIVVQPWEYIVPLRSYGYEAISPDSARRLLLSYVRPVSPFPLPPPDPSIQPTPSPIRRFFRWLFC